MEFENYIRSMVPNPVKTGIVIAHIALNSYTVRTGGGRVIVKSSKPLREGEFISFTKMHGEWHFSKTHGDQGNIHVIRRDG